VVSSWLNRPEHKFVTAGGFKSNSGFCGIEVTMYKQFYCLFNNHEESDTQIWLHVKESSCSVVHIYSIDRDISMIGLPLALSKEVVIQYRAKPGDTKFINLKKLKYCLERDPDLASIVERGHDLCKIIQVVFICSGCDFVSYFVRLGKRSFFNTFFQYATFICGLIGNSQGILSNTTLDEDSDFGLLSFYRFIGCVYSSAHRSCLNKYISPVELLNSLNCNSQYNLHVKFLEIIRKATWKGTYEDELLPSAAALRFHWLSLGEYCLGKGLRSHFYVS
jgi:hypothetical protein